MPGRPQTDLTHPFEELEHAALFSAYGVEVGVLSNAAPFLEALARRLPSSCFGSVPPADLRSPTVRRVFSVVARDRVQIYEGGVPLGRSARPSAAVDALRSEIQLELAEWAPHHFVVHAGVVGWQGRALVFPGRSFSGKSRLAEALVRAGATYYSDEFGVFDDRGRVLPYARPIAIRGPEGSPASLRTAEDLGGDTGVEALEVSTILLTRFVEGASWQPRPARAGFAATRLIRQCLTARQRPERTISALSLVCSSARIVKGLRGDASQVVTWLRAPC